MTNSQILRKACGALGLAAAAGVAGVSVAVLSAESATAAPAPLTQQYTCSFPFPLDNQQVTVTLDSAIPNSALVGEPTSEFAIKTTAPVDATTTSGLGILGVKTIEGTVDAKAVVAAPQGDIPVTVPLVVPRTNIPESGVFDVRATGTAPAFTFERAGTAKITVNSMIMHLVPRDASGNVHPETVDASCTLDAGQNNIVASFDIAEAGTAIDPSMPGVSSPTTATPRAITGSTAPPATSRSTAGPSTSASATAPRPARQPRPLALDTSRPATTPSSSTAASIHPVNNTPKRLILLAVGGAIAGALVLAVVFRFGGRTSRWGAPRRP